MDSTAFPRNQRLNNRFIKFAGIKKLSAIKYGSDVFYSAQIQTHKCRYSTFVLTHHLKAKKQPSTLRAAMSFQFQPSDPTEEETF